MKTYLRIITGLALAAVLFLTSSAQAQCAFKLTSKNGEPVTYTFYVKSLIAGASSGQITISGTDAASFKVEPATFEFTDMGQKKEVKITYTPSSNTVRASATIEVGGMGMICYSGTLIGAIKNSNPLEPYVVVDPMQFVFPATAVGEESCKEFKVFNKGTASAWISGWSLLTEWPNDFTMDATTTDVKELKAGENLVIKVCYKPTEERTTTVSGYLVVNYSSEQNPAEWNKIKAWFGTKKEDNGGNDTVKNKYCIQQLESDWRGQVALDSTAERVLRIKNVTNSSITITGLKLDGEDANAFTVAQTLVPITIEAGATAEIPFTFTPYATSSGKAKEKYFAYLVMSFQASSGLACTDAKVVLYGYSIYVHDGDKNTDSTKTVGINLFGDGKTTIGLSNKGIRESYTLLFVNNLQVDATIISVAMKVGTHFTVTETNPAALPFTLKPGESFTVTIAYESTDNLIHKDALVITAEHSLTSIEFDVEGGDFSVAKVKNELPTGVAIFVSPNPARSDVKVDFTGTMRANIEVIDVLGNVVATGETSGDWTWNGKTASGVTAANGAYIIRISGTSITGEQFVTSKRVILEK
jgi:hypothetical protein